MAEEFFNYQRNKSGNFIVSTDYAVMTLISSSDSATPGAVAKALMQDTTIRYEHRVTLVPEQGSHEMYFLTGQAQGQAQITRAIGQGGLMESMAPGGKGTLNKGAIGSLQMEVSSGDTASEGTAQLGLEFTNVIKTAGVVMRSVQWTSAVANLQFNEAIELVIASMMLER